MKNVLLQFKKKKKDIILSARMMSSCNLEQVTERLLAFPWASMLLCTRE